MLNRIFLSPVGLFIYLFVLAAATTLITHLGRGTVPPRLEALAVRWQDAGYNPRHFRLILWVCFWLVAAVFFAALGYAMYVTATDLGTGFRNWH